MDLESEDGIFKLLTKLSYNIAQSNNGGHPSKTLVSKMRSHSYEIILKKSQTRQKSTNPITDLLLCYYIAHQKASNVAEYENAAKLKKIIEVIRQKHFKDSSIDVHQVLKLLALLSSTEKDYSNKNFQNPWSYGLLDQILPKPKQEVFGSVEPYSYYPSHMFDLPYSLKAQREVQEMSAQCCTVYSVGCFDSLLPASLSQNVGELKTFVSPMSLASLSSTHCSPLPNLGFDFKLAGSRDLQIPQLRNVNAVDSLNHHSVTIDDDIKEVYRAKDESALDIWELASQLDKECPDNIWEIVAIMPPVKESEMLASRRVLGLCHPVPGVLTEEQLVKHIICLLFGIETSTFYYNREKNVFLMKDKKTVLKWYPMSSRLVRDLLMFGTHHKWIYDFAFNPSLDDGSKCQGIIREASMFLSLHAKPPGTDQRAFVAYAMDAMDAQVLLAHALSLFRPAVSNLFGSSVRVAMQGYLVDFRARLSALPEVSGVGALTALMLRLQQLKHELATMVSLLQGSVIGPQGLLSPLNDLMSRMFCKVSLLTHATSSPAAFGLLISMCKVYFKFIERFVFDGELDDSHYEFFIKQDVRSERSRSNRYWNSAFFLSNLFKVPEFLEDLAKRILLCGKTLRLLKICNPNDPLVYLITSDHPTVRCCTTLEQLSQQRAELEVYRTRCRFVGGEPVTFQQILLEKEAERQACAELAAAKQAETIEKIIAERKRLAQLMVAEKKHYLRVLKAAMKEAKAAKQKARKRVKTCEELEAQADAAAEEVDSALRESEKTKIMEYYSRLNEHVEKRKMRTDWRFRRLQLDQSRIQLLTTEERNYKREKMELECKWNEEMAMSTRSDIYLDARSTPSELEDKLVVSCDDINIFSSRGTSEYELCKTKASATDFGTTRDTVDSDRKFEEKTKASTIELGTKYTVDSNQKLDEQGNVIQTEPSNVESKTSSSVIGKDLDNTIDNQQYLDTRQQALLNKQAVMAHEYDTDVENNTIKPKINVQYFDTENNDLTPNQEAMRNKLKVLGDEFNLPVPEVRTAEPRTDAQREAVVNKLKVLGAEYHLPCESAARREPANVAQEEALRNKKKVLESEFDVANTATSGSEVSSGAPKDNASKNQNAVPSGQGSAKRLTLNLNLKPPDVSFSKLITTPKIYESEEVATPSVMPVTPSNPDMLMNVETPNQESYFPIDSAKASSVPSKKSIYGAFEAKRFDYSLLVDDEAAELLANETLSSDGLEASPLKNLVGTPTKGDIGSSTDGFDPFGLNRIRAYSTDAVDSKEDLDSSPSAYTHPAFIMEEARKKPSNMFLLHSEEKKEICDNIASLAFCLHGSVSQPLTYQLEVLNNSILTYFLVDLDMYGHMCALKDYFFLLDGDFSRSVCSNIFAKLASTTNPQELLNFVTLRGILDKALGSTGSQHRDKYSDNLSFTISDPAPLSFQLSSPDALQCLSLTYAVQWPLNIILSQEALLKYSKAFQFLLKMKRIAWVLVEDYEYLKRRLKIPQEYARKLRRSPQYITLQNYRHIMATLIKALDSYITTSCILASWRDFENDLKKARTLDDIYECHVVYVKKVLFRCLLNKRSTPVMKLFNDIFTVILKFSRVLQTGCWNSSGGHYVHDGYEKLDELFHIFEQLYRYLHKVITRLLECNYQQQLLDDLLTTINFNGYCRVDKPQKPAWPWNPLTFAN